MNYWLFKSEPDSFSIDDLKQCPKQTEPWNGVRNYQVRNMLRDEIKVGDLAFFYHSSCPEPGIAGVMKVVKNGYPDFSAFDSKSKYFDANTFPDKPRWFMVDVKFVKKFPQIISLATLRAKSALKDMLILRQGNRLSITAVTEKQWDAIMKIAE